MLTQKSLNRDPRSGFLQVFKSPSCCRLLSSSLPEFILSRIFCCENQAKGGVGSLALNISDNREQAYGFLT